MTIHLALLSSKSWDIDFLNLLKASTFRSHIHFLNIKAAPGAVDTFDQVHPGAIFFVDFELLSSGVIDFSAFSERVWAIGDIHPSVYPLQGILAQASHYLLRGLDPAQSAEAVAQLMGLMRVSAGPGPSSDAVPEVLDLSLMKSSDRQSALDELSIRLESRALPARLQQLVLTGADELMMNAIFDAPVSKDGERFRYHLNRNRSFHLSQEENIRLQLVSAPRFGVLSVLDGWGSLKKEELLTERPAPPPESPSAAFGIQSILRSGLSLFFSVRSGNLTQASLVFPKSQSLSEMRSAFQAVSFRGMRESV